jgi:hypothetical protein
MSQSRGASKCNHEENGSAPVIMAATSLLDILNVRNAIKAIVEVCHSPYQLDPMLKVNVHLRFLWPYLVIQEQCRNL